MLPTSTTTLPNVEVCTGDDNKGINFERIRNVQTFLNNYGFNAGDVDGYLGNQTIAAIKDFQRYAGLYPDGDVGPLTRNAMNNWTGCEGEATQIITTTTTVPSSNDSNTTTTTLLLQLQLLFHQIVFQYLQIKIMVIYPQFHYQITIFFLYLNQ